LCLVDDFDHARAESLQSEISSKFDS